MSIDNTHRTITWEVNHAWRVDDDLDKSGQSQKLFASGFKWQQSFAYILFADHFNFCACFTKTFNTLRTGDADLRFYITTVQDG